MRRRRGLRHGARGHRQTGAAAQPGRGRRAVSGATVLVVNDDEMIRDVLRDALELEGYAVVTAEDGAQALTAVRTASPALILTDALMPVMDGLAFLRAYRAGPGPHAPVVAMSGGAPGAQAELEGLADAMLPLPYDLGELLALVDRYAGRLKSVLDVSA